jgi:glycosyltransferase involved in cell wall biosynthesis
VQADSPEKHEAFLTSSRKHILMITNHGIHQWQVLPGLPDTGGQNVFVNRFTGELVEQGFRVTIVNRGGYPHPKTGEPRQGLRYRDEHQRILYLEDGLEAFVRKEEMHERLPHLVGALEHFLTEEGTRVDLILSHYWDGAALGARYNRRRDAGVHHVWIPHSLGTVKKRNVEPERWEDLRIEERIAVERSLVEKVDGVAATSSIIRRALREDYGYTGPDLFLPPCVDVDRYHPRALGSDDELWDFLASRCDLSPEEVRRRRIVTEISRTDTTKRKDVLIEAFAAAHRRVPESLLLVSIDEGQQPLAQELFALIEERGVGDAVAVVGSVPEWLPRLYAASAVYCTPSVMEGFGMSAQEAAATGVPVVASDLVPFAVEHLLGEEIASVPVEGSAEPLRVGEGAVVVPADDVRAFAQALERLLLDDELRTRLGEGARRITVPYFTWSSRVPAFLEAIDVEPDRG